MVTRKQIASVCGVSAAAAGKALNNAPDISTETAERIRKAAGELGYYPNSAARALKTDRTRNIGVLFEDDTHCGLTHEYFSHVLNAVKSSAESRGCDVTFISDELKNMTVLNERLSLASSLGADKAAELEMLAGAIVESVKA